MVNVAGPPKRGRESGKMGGGGQSRCGCAGGGAVTARTASNRGDDWLARRGTDFESSFEQEETEGAEDFRGSPTQYSVPGTQHRELSIVFSCLFIRLRHTGPAPGNNRLPGARCLLQKKEMMGPQGRRSNVAMCGARSVSQTVPSGSRGQWPGCARPRAVSSTRGRFQGLYKCETVRLRTRPSGVTSSAATERTVI